VAGLAVLLVHLPAAIDLTFTRRLLRGEGLRNAGDKRSADERANPRPLATLHG